MWFFSDKILLFFTVRPSTNKFSLLFWLQIHINFSLLLLRTGTGLGWGQHIWCGTCLGLTSGWVSAGSAGGTRVREASSLANSNSPRNNEPGKLSHFFSSWRALTQHDIMWQSFGSPPMLQALCVSYICCIRAVNMWHEQMPRHHPSVMDLCIPSPIIYTQALQRAQLRSNAAQSVFA